MTEYIDKKISKIQDEIKNIVLLKELEKKKSEIDIKKSIKNYCSSKLDKYKVPVKINFVDKIEFTNRFKKVIK